MVRRVPGTAEQPTPSHEPAVTADIQNTRIATQFELRKVPHDRRQAYSSVLTAASHETSPRTFQMATVGVSANHRLIANRWADNKKASADRAGVRKPAEATQGKVRTEVTVEPTPALA